MDENWLPIATAPRDGTDVLLWAESWEHSWGIQKGNFYSDEWHCEEGSVKDNEPGFDPDAEVGDDYDPDQDTNYGPTHWLPIARPPSDARRAVASPETSHADQ